MRRFSAVASAAIAVMLLILAAPAAHAVVTGTVQAHLTHSFVVGNTTLPPGKYDFHMVQGTDNEVMDMANAAHSVNVEFLVQPSIDSHTPKHSELVFDRYGKFEVLTKIYAAGSPNGERVIEPSHLLARLKKEHQKPFEHTEEQSQ